MVSKLLLAPRAAEKATFVMRKLGANLENPRYLGLKKCHMVDVIL
jgi:hypothetical protein